MSGDEWDDMLIQSGYVYCRPHAEWHRPPECPIDTEGYPLMSCGCRWPESDDDEENHRDDCPVYGQENPT